MVQTLELIQFLRHELQFVKEVEAGLYDDKIDILPEYKSSFVAGVLESTIEIALRRLERSLPTPEDDPKESPLGYNPYME